MRDLRELGRALASTDGVNSWDAITKADFGFSFDYIIERHGSITVLDPTSKAAMEWLYKHLPADCPRWGKLGFAIESNYVGEILERMADDGLMSEEEYVFAMNAEERDRHAGERL